MKKENIVLIIGQSLTLLILTLLIVLIALYERGKNKESQNLKNFHTEEQIREVLVSFKLAEYKVEVYPKIIWYASKDLMWAGKKLHLWRLWSLI